MLTKKKKILIVDDDPDMRRGLSARLNANGYDTVFAADAPGAVSVAQRERPNLILLDLGLPGGDGFLVLQRLKSLVPLSGVPVIVITGREPATNEERAFAAGAQRYFHKPLDLDGLMSAIDSALGSEVA